MSLRAAGRGPHILRRSLSLSIRRRDVAIASASAPFAHDFTAGPSGSISVRISRAPLECRGGSAPPRHGLGLQDRIGRGFRRNWTAAHRVSARGDKQSHSDRHSAKSQLRHGPNPSRCAHCAEKSQFAKMQAPHEASWAPDALLLKLSGFLRLRSISIEQRVASDDPAAKRNEGRAGRRR
jgi:hypothetical protein